MGISALAADERVADVRFDDDRIIVDLMDDRTVAAPLAWYPRLKDASPAERAHWQLAGEVERVRRHLARRGEVNSAPPSTRPSPAAEDATAYRKPLVPAKAGTQPRVWIPARAGMSGGSGDASAWQVEGCGRTRHNLVRCRTTEDRNGRPPGSPREMAR